MAPCDSSEQLRRQGFSSKGCYKYQFPILDGDAPRSTWYGNITGLSEKLPVSKCP